MKFETYIKSVKILMAERADNQFVNILSWGVTR